MAMNLSNLSRAFLAHFAERVEYNGASGRVAFDAIVDRESVASVDGIPGTTSPTANLYVRNCRAKGVEAKEIRTGGRDKVLIAVRPGEAPQWRPVASILESDDAFVVLEVR